ncbi:MAG: DoxX family protein [Bacteroidetes bacterium]|nr:DoxX family protein [Bacteroidota bacterium]
MKSKKLTILYWVFTILFILLMLFATIGGIQPNADTIKFMHDGLGYPIYFIQFISIAKVIGCIVLVIPGLKRIKEWAYAGLFFDLVAAVYSNIAVAGKVDPAMLSLIAWFGTGILSYYYWRKLNP